MHKFTRTIIFIFFISFLPRVILLGAVMAKNNGNASCFFCADSDRYYKRAISFSGKSGVYLSPYEDTEKTLPWDPPLYSLFLAVFFKLFGPSPLLASFLNIMLFSICACVLYKIGGIIFDERAAFMAAAIFSFYPSLLIFTLLILIEPLFTLLILIGAYFFILYLKRRKGLFLILSAASTGLSNWAKEAAFFLPLVMAIVILLKHIKQPKALFRTLPLLMAVYIITLAPLSIYNYNKFGSYWLSGKMQHYFSLRYFDFLSRQKPDLAPPGGIENPKNSLALEINLLPLKRYFVKRKHFFGGTGTLSMLRVFGYDIANDETGRAMWQLKGPFEFLAFIRQKAGMRWVIYQCLAWIFVACVYITSFLALLVLFFRKKYLEAIFIILMIAYFSCVYYYPRNSRYFYSLTPFFSLLSGYCISSLAKER
ncbi:MAG TPA: glycosyltransferase family 39 protein [Candidatus Margulisiibacteriota bacterium]|nr:glycosyltransferase family 39 protein [Candidatus Margulisiibacteriota bacterium]